MTIVISVIVGLSDIVTGPLATMLCPLKRARMAGVKEQGPGIRHPILVLWEVVLVR